MEKTESKIKLIKAKTKLCAERLGFKKRSSKKKLKNLI